MSVGSSITPVNSAIDLQSQIAPQLADDAAMYSIVCCFLLNQEILHVPKLKQWPIVLFLIPTSLPYLSQQNHEEKFTICCISDAVMNNDLQTSEHMLSNFPMRPLGL
jgi:hypothetical protein